MTSPWHNPASYIPEPEPRHVRRWSPWWIAVAAATVMLAWWGIAG